MDHIAFFWVGNDTRIPQCLVDSARLVYGQDVCIHQLSEETTPAIAGVDQVVRTVLSPFIMVARLQAYAALPPQDGMVFYCDADSLIINRLQLHTLDPQHIHIVPRDNGSALVNPHYPEHYQEFEGKTLNEVMPFLFGAMAVQEGDTFFTHLLALCLALPERFQRWYGDQVALFAYYQRHALQFTGLDALVFLHIERDVISAERFHALVLAGTRMVTFKGPSTKTYIHPSLENLRLSRAPVH
jgi:hypothetical protein